LGLWSVLLRSPARKLYNMGICYSFADVPTPDAFADARAYLFLASRKPP